MTHSNKADELWEKYKQPGKFDGFTGDIVCKLDFLAALAEYGAMVRKEDVEVCEKVDDEIGPANETNWDSVCAAAIERMPLP